MTYLLPSSQWNVSYQLMWWGRTVICISQRVYKLGWTADKTERGDYNCNRHNFTAISLLSHTVPSPTVCRQQAGATHQDSSVHWWQNCQYNVWQPTETSVSGFPHTVFQQLFLWWCRPTGAINRINCRLLYVVCKISEYQQLKNRYQINHQQVFTAACY